MAEFKVGDKVKFTSNCIGSHSYIGSEGIVKYVDNNASYDAHHIQVVYDGGAILSHREDELQIVKSNKMSSITEKFALAFLK